MKKAIKITGIFIILLVIASFFYIKHLKAAALPDYNENIKISKLSAPVNVYRNAYAVPGIVAQNEQDLYKVVGYISAQDRLWQMDLLRRVTQGRLSEIFGKDLIETDIFLRKLRLPDNSEKLWDQLDEPIKKVLINYADGVNQYIDSHQDNLPFEFSVLGYKPEKWEPQHSMNLVGFMAWNLEMGYRMEIILHQLKNQLTKEQFAALFPDYDAMNTYAYPSFQLPEIKMDTTLVAAIENIRNLTPDIFNGSNNWVVAGKKSTTGKPIFSNDMHLGLDIPGIWTRMHFIIPGKLNVTGVVLPGEPFIVAGHNENIAWGMTNVMLDGADFYVETINPDNPSQYKFNGKWKEMEVRNEKIYIKGEDKPVEKTLFFTHRGPIISRFGELQTVPLSMRWIGNEPTHEIDALYALATASNWDEFCHAIQGFNSVSQNIAYADVQGNIGIHLTGKIPKRTAPGYMIYPGDTNKYDWKGFVPFDSLPYEYNPARGFVSSANNKSVNKDYPYYISEWYDAPYRINRIRQMLTAKEKLSTDDFKQMLFDHHSVQADDIKPVLLQHLKKEKNWNKTEQKALTILEKWDNRYETGKTAPLIFDQFLIDFTASLVKDEFKDTLFEAYHNSMLSKYLTYNVFKKNNSLFSDNINTPEKEDFHQIVIAGFKTAIQNIEKNYGDLSQITWGKVHHYNLQHPLGKVKMIDWAFDLNRIYEAPGNSNTVNPFAYVDGKAFDSQFGASEKHIFNTANWDNSYSILPTGISGIPASKHYCDQSEKYVKGEILHDYFSLDRIKKDAVYHQLFETQ
jgi:penicillin amidase